MSLNTISSIVSITIAVDKIVAFSQVVPIDLRSIFKGYGLLPAVISIQAQTGNWDAIWQTRTVHLSDGSSAKELLIQYQSPNYFAYVVSNFSGALGWLITSATGEWWFESCPGSPVGEACPVDNRTIVRWSYTFTPKSWFAIPILWIINKFLWSGYMRSVMSNVKIQLETQQFSF
jgi:hypothetical protein